MIVIGIGGSYLGSKAAETAMRNPFSNGIQKPIFFCGHHLSESSFVDFLHEIEGRKPLICMISKSGTTTEPGLCFRLMRSWLTKNFPEDQNQRIIAITDKEKGALRQFATEKSWLSFDIPDDVGGRYSVLTPVGMVPLALAGFDVEGIMAGAGKMYFDIFNDEDHPCLKYAASRSAIYESGKSIEILSITDPKLLFIAEWWKQLFGESEGKEHKGLFPASMIFTTDLHSLGQYVQDGKRSIAETFLTFGKNRKGMLEVPQAEENLDNLNYLKNKTMHDVNEAARQGTMLAHFDGGVPCIELDFPEMGPQSLGACFAFFQSACAISALMLKLNPFDQPGVEDYKRNLFAIMNKPGYEELSEKIKARLP